jgi:hypothetical protein
LRFDPSPSSSPKVFADANKIAAWAKPAVDEFSRLGILEGDGKGYLSPAEPLSRLRFLVFLDKFNTRLDGKNPMLPGMTVFSRNMAVF